MKSAKPSVDPIAYTLSASYRPDFVALDVDGVHWVIEGKSQVGVDDAVVAQKRRAAEYVLPRIMSDPVMSEQHWGYAIAFEKDVERAESWDELIALTAPVRTRIFE